MSMLKMAEDFLLEFVKTAVENSSKVDIGPITADMIERRRQMVQDADANQYTHQMMHTGWNDVVASMGVVDATVLYSFLRELADAWEVPISVPMCFRWSMHSAPSKMYATCNGMLPLVTEDNHSTAELLRLAWDGVGKYWDTEDVLSLPPPHQPLPEDMLEKMQHDGNEFVIQTIDAWFTGHGEQFDI